MKKKEPLAVEGGVARGSCRRDGVPGGGLPVLYVSGSEICVRPLSNQSAATTHTLGFGKKYLPKSVDRVRGR